MKVLVADDSPDAVSALTTLLESGRRARVQGHEVRGVQRSADVLGAEREFRPDAVILDLQMQEISGYDLARWLRSRHPRRCPLLIAVTGAYTRPADRRLSRFAGFDFYLTKPFEIDELLFLLR